MEDSVFALLYRQLRERRQSMADYLISGAPGDYTEYVRAAAKHETLLTIEEDVKELEKRFIDI